MTSGLDLPDWNQGLTTSWDPEVPAGITATNLHQSVGRVPAASGAQAGSHAPSAALISRHHDPHALKAQGLAVLPNATQAAYWTERAAKHVEAGHTQAAMEALQEGRARDARPASAIDAALGQLKGAVPHPGSPAAARRGATPLRSGLKGRAVRLAGSRPLSPHNPPAQPRPTTGFEDVLKRLAFASASVRKPGAGSRLCVAGASGDGAGSGAGGEVVRDPAAKQLCFGATPPPAGSQDLGGAPSPTHPAAASGRRVRFFSPASETGTGGGTPSSLAPSRFSRRSSTGPSEAGSTPFHRLVSKYGPVPEDEEGSLGTDDWPEGADPLDSPSWERLSTGSTSDSIQVLTGRYRGGRAGDAAGPAPSAAGWRANGAFGLTPSPPPAPEPGRDAGTPAVLLTGEAGRAGRCRGEGVAGPSDAHSAGLVATERAGPSDGPASSDRIAPSHRLAPASDLASPPRRPWEGRGPAASPTPSLRSWPLEALSPDAWRFCGGGPEEEERVSDGVERDGQGVPTSTPATVTIFRGAPPRRGGAASASPDGAGVAADLFGAGGGWTPSPTGAAEAPQTAPPGSGTARSQGSAAVSADPDATSHHHQASSAPPLPTLETLRPGRGTPGLGGPARRVAAAAAEDARAPEGGPRGLQAGRRELSALLADLRLEGGAAAATRPLLGTLPLLTPVRASAAVQGATGQRMAATPVRRSARKLRDSDPSTASAAALAATDYAYVPNPMLPLSGEDATAGRQGDSPLLPQDDLPPLSDQPLVNPPPFQARRRAGAPLSSPEEGRGAPGSITRSAARRRGGAEVCAPGSRPAASHPSPSLDMSPTERGIRRSLRRSARKSRQGREAEE
ncbi:hypothetical protein ACKKBG_A07830 [Auxenochlorella protothecoides x Auxenochlorella symbiontica]